MAPSRVLLIAAAVLALAAPGSGQTADPDRARVLLDSAAAALGMDAFNRVDVLDLRSEGVSPWTGQGASPAEPTRYRRLERRTLVDFRRSRFHQRNVSRYPDGAAISCSSSRARGEEVIQYDCFSQVADRASPGASAEALISSWRLTRPYGWIEAARRSIEGIQVSEKADGGAKLAFEMGGVERVLHLRPRTHLPGRVEWSGRDVLGRSVTRVLEYDDYRNLGGFRFPFHLVYRNPGGSGQELRYLDVRVDVSAPDSLFVPPSDARRVVAYAMDGRPHVDEIVIPYMPEQRMMYVADLFWKGATGHVRPADRETNAFVEILAELEVEPDLLVLAHGEPATLQELETALRLEPGVR